MTTNDRGYRSGLIVVRDDQVPVRLEFTVPIRCSGLL